MGYKTNKFRRKAEVEKGGWQVAWADDIAEKDVAVGIIAAGVSAYSGNAAPFIAWVNHLVQRTWVSLAADLQEEIREEAEKLAQDVISDAIKGKSSKETFRRFEKVDFKAGAISYSGRNTLLGATLTRTWGLKPYVAFRLREPAGTAKPPTTSNGVTDAQPQITVNVQTTDAIIGHVNNSREVRKFGAPVYVKINAIDSHNNLLLAGTDVNNPNIEDAEHSRIIRRMATLAWTLGKPLRIEMVKLENGKVFAKGVAILEDG